MLPSLCFSVLLALGSSTTYRNATVVKHHVRLGAPVVGSNYGIVYVELQDFLAPQHENGFLHSYVNGLVDQWDYYAFRVDAGHVVKITLRQTSQMEPTR